MTSATIRATAPCWSASRKSCKISSASAGPRGNAKIKLAMVHACSRTVAVGFSHSSSLLAAVGLEMARNVIPVLPACEPLWRALRQAVASRLVFDCSWQLRYAHGVYCYCCARTLIRPGEPPSARAGSCCWRSCQKSGSGKTESCKPSRRNTGHSSLPRSTTLWFVGFQHTHMHDTYTTAHAHVWHTFFCFSHQHSTIPPTMQAQVRLR